MAVSLVSRVRTVLGTHLEVDSVFENPTVGELMARAVSEHVGEGAFDRVLAFRQQGDLPPLFCLPPGGGLGWVYAGLLRELDPQRPLYCLQTIDARSEKPLPTSIEEAAQEYLAIIREIQPVGPYHLLGWSFGGLLAHIIACSLQRDRQEVSLLAILDACPPKKGVAQSAADLELDWMPEEDPRPNYFALSPERRQRVWELIKYFAKLEFGFPPYTFEGDILLFTPSERDRTIWQLWEPHVAGRINVQQIECKYREVVDSKHLRLIGRRLQEQIHIHNRQRARDAGASPPESS